MNLGRIATWADVPDRIPIAANAEGLDLVDDLTRFDRDTAALTGIEYGGVR